MEITQADHAALPSEPVDFDTPAKKGWSFFTKFLLWNVVSCAAILVLIGIFTVWS